MAVHVYIDNSNIWIGLQNLCCKLENVPPIAVRIDLNKLDKYVVAGRKTGEKWMAGSIPPESGDYLAIANNLGYNTNFVPRVTENSYIREQGVDANLQLQMSMALNLYEGSQVMAVLTGDSHVDRDSQRSFIQIIEIALKKGWTVEVYAAKECISDAVYDPLREKYGDQLIITPLDNVYQNVTFIKEGDYYFPDDPNKKKIHVNKRYAIAIA